MKATRKTDGKVIEVIAGSIAHGMKVGYHGPDGFYNEDELIFNIPDDFAIQGYIARDEDQSLTLFQDEPHVARVFDESIEKVVKTWVSSKGGVLVLPKDMCPEIKSDNTPLAVTIKISPNTTL